MKEKAEEYARSNIEAGNALLQRIIDMYKDFALKHSKRLPLCLHVPPECESDLKCLVKIRCLYDVEVYDFRRPYDSGSITEHAKGNTITIREWMDKYPEWTVRDFYSGGRLLGMSVLFDADELKVT